MILKRIIVCAGIIIILAFLVFSYINTFHKPPLNRSVTIGIIVRGSSYTPGVEGFKKKMAELGYEEGKNVRYDTVFVDKREDIAPVIKRFIDEHVDLIHTYSTPVTVEAYRQTKTIPIVFGSMGDPLASQTVHSLQGSGTNVTGINSLSAPLVVKRLEYLVEAVPGVKKIAIPFTPDDIAAKSSYTSAQQIASKLRISMIPYYISPERSVQDTARAISHRDVDSIVLAADSSTWANLDLYIAQSIKEKLPFSVFDKDMVVKGGLIGYGPDYFVCGEQSAVIAEKILHGQQPGELPIENPKKFILAINLDTAAAIGVHLPQTLLDKADMIIQTKK